MNLLLALTAYIAICWLVWDLPLWRFLCVILTVGLIAGLLFGAGYDFPHP